MARYIREHKKVTGVRYSYLPQQFGNIEHILKDLRAFVPSGDFTLGKPLSVFEEKFAQLIGSKYAIGVGSGTDALKLSLKAVDVGPGDEVITAANTFIATVGAIAELFARPVLVDCNDTFCIDADLIERAITEKTKAIMPVHFTGYPCEMDKIMKIAQKYKLPVVEDACQSILARFRGQMCGTFGIAAGYSLHPLKNLNVWGDGGVIVTSDEAMNKKLRLLRNHGMRNRDEIEIMGCNSRLDTLQAVVGNHLIDEAPAVSQHRIANADYYDKHFKDVRGLRIPPRYDHHRRVYHIYIVFAERRDELYQYCVDRNIECKVHYPIPLYQQDALKQYDYKAGTFPVTDRHCQEVISFPCDQYLVQEELDYVIETVREFYGN